MTMGECVINMSTKRQLEGCRVDRVPAAPTYRVSMAVKLRGSGDKYVGPCVKRVTAKSGSNM